MNPLKRLLIAAALLAFPHQLQAGQIDLLLEIDYAGASSSTGGSWRLVASADEQGLFSLRVPISGIDSGVTSLLPAGRINGSPTVNAGFSTFVNVPQANFRDLFFAQQNAPLDLGGSTQQGVFYGVGTFTNGAPNFPGRPVGTNAIGPNLTTLTGVTGLPWGNEPNLAGGVAVASGSFSAGQIPDFSSVGVFQATVLTAIGDLSEPGPTTADVTFTTEVIDDLAFGVATGDYNGDGVVDIADYTIFRDTLNQSFSPLTGADGDGDGLITQGDYAVWLRNFGRVQPGGLAAAAVPEPAAGTLVLGALALGLRGAGHRTGSAGRKNR